MMSGGKFLRLFTLLLATAIAAGNKIPICHRHQHMTRVGYVSAAMIKEITMDTGRCKMRNVRSNKKIKQDWVVCQAGDECSVKSVTTKHVHFYDGVMKEVDVIKKCQCQTPAQNCQRGRFDKTFFPGTVYETTLDVGRCVGPCSAGAEACLPIRNTTHMIDTPNGPTAIQNITECNCDMAICHRVPYFDAFQEDYVNDKNETSSRPRRVDVGKCVGYDSCNGAESHECLNRELNGNCVFYATQKQRCRPNNSTLETFRTTARHDASFMVVRSCLCW